MAASIVKKILNNSSLREKVKIVVRQDLMVTRRFEITVFKHVVQQQSGLSQQSNFDEIALKKEVEKSGIMIFSKLRGDQPPHRNWEKFLRQIDNTIRNYTTIQKAQQQQHILLLDQLKQQQLPAN
eukprot:403358535